MEISTEYTMDPENSEFSADLDPPELHEPANDEYVKIDKAQGSGEGSSSPEVISSPEGEEEELLPTTTDGTVNVGFPLTEEPENKETSPTIEPPPVPEVTAVADPISHEAEPSFIPSEEPPQDFTLPELPPARTGMTGGSVEDIPMERRTAKPKPFITSHTESFSPSSRPDLPKATGYLSFLNVFHPVVLQLIYWKDVKLSGVSLAVAMAVLLTLYMNTLLHAMVLVVLASMVVSLVYIVTKVAIDSFYNREIRNPLLTYLEKDLNLPEKKVLDITKFVIRNTNCFFKCFMRLVFFEKIVNSMKLMVALFLVSYVTNCLDVLTSLFIAVVLLFSVPPIYNQYQDLIDMHLERNFTKFMDLYTQVSHKIPFLPKAKED